MRLLAALCVALVACGSALAPAIAAPTGTATPVVKPLKQILPNVPTPPAVLALVRTTLIAVDHGNKTGNYTVLRDMGAPSFREANNASKLAAVFSSLVTQRVDMLPVLVVTPAYREPARLTAQRMLYIAGRFDIQPKAVSFELLFEVTRGEWRLYGVSIVPG